MTTRWRQETGASVLIQTEPLGLSRLRTQTRISRANSRGAEHSRRESHANAPRKKRLRVQQRADLFGWSRTRDEVRWIHREVVLVLRLDEESVFYSDWKASEVF